MVRVLQQYDGRLNVTTATEKDIGHQLVRIRRNQMARVIVAARPVINGRIALKKSQSPRRRTRRIGSSRYRSVTLTTFRLNFLSRIRLAIVAHDYSAVVDPGSPVSFIRCQYVPANLRGLAPPNGDHFCGMNKSRVRVLGTLSKTVQVEGIEINICFLIVPNETMSCAMLLGRDFTRNPLIKVELGETIKVTENSVTSAEVSCVTETMQIEYLDSPTRVNEELNIDSDIDVKTADKVRELYNKEYVEK